MPDYTFWDKDDGRVTALQLDSKNPRLPGLGHTATLREIVAELISHEDVLELAKSIATQGYMPTEVLICVVEQKELVVIEGNRRLASLKLLLSPELAPKEVTTRVKKIISSRVGDPVVKVPIVIAPDRASAVPLMVGRHNQTAIKKWEPIQQARFIKALLSIGQTLDQVATATGSLRSNLAKTLRTYSIYEMATSLQLPPSIAITLNDPRQFTYSTFERAIESPHTRRFLGITFSDSGDVIGDIHPVDFKKRLSLLVSDIASDKINTRIINKSDSIAKYIDNLEAQVPGPARSGQFNASDILTTPPDENSNKLNKPAARPKTRYNKCLVPRLFKSQVGLQRIDAVLSELKKLQVDGFENSVAIMLRILLDMSATSYLDQTGKMDAVIRSLDKKSAKSAVWTPSLRQMLTAILQDPSVRLPIPRQALKAVNKALSDDNYPLSLDGMDQFAHNPYMSPTEKQLRQYWDIFGELIGFLLQDHSNINGPGK